MNMETLKVSIPLKQLHKATVDRILNKKHDKFVNKDRPKDVILLKTKIQNPPADEKKDQTEMPTLPTKRFTATEIEARLLLSLSNNNINYHFNQKEHPPDSKQHEKIGATEAPPANPSIEKYTKVSQSNHSQTDHIYTVIKEDYNLIQMIRAKGLTVEELSRMRVDDGRARSVKDINNNSSDEIIDLCLDENNDYEIDKAMYDNLVTCSFTYKQVAAMLFEAFKGYKIDNQNSVPVDINKSMHSSKIMKVSKSITDMFRNAPVKVSFNKETQTNRLLKDSEGLTTHFHKSSGLLASAQNICSTTKSQKTDATHLANRHDIQVHQVAVTPVSGKQCWNNTQQSNEQTVTPHQQPTAAASYANSYPATRMMSALELPELRQQFSNWNNSYAAATATDRMCSLNQHYAANAATATSALPSQAASFSAAMQQSSGCKAPPVRAQPIYQPITPTGLTPPDPWQFVAEDNRPGSSGHRASRRLKNTIRGMPYTLNGPKFPTPQIVGKYKLLMEQQKIRTMLEQQQAWSRQLQNYPNTAWGQENYKGKF